MSREPDDVIRSQITKDLNALQLPSLKHKAVKHEMDACDLEARRMLLPKAQMNPSQTLRVLRLSICPGFSRDNYWARKLIPILFRWKISSIALIRRRGFSMPHLLLRPVHLQIRLNKSLMHRLAQFEGKGLWATKFLYCLFIGALGFGTNSFGAVLNPETLKAWQSYKQSVRLRMQDRLRPERPFLSIEEHQDNFDKVRKGGVFVSPVGHTPQTVPAGLIHDWIGAEFIPNTNVNEVLTTVRDYDNYKLFYGPNVSKSRMLSKTDSQDRFSMMLVNKSLISKTSLDSDYECSYFRVDDRHWYSISETLRMQEVENAGTAEQRTLSEDKGTGLIWKLMSVSRFEERDGGVYVELEAVALSRDVPPALRWLVTPVVRRVSKSSISISLQQTGEAVHSRHAPKQQVAKDKGNPSVVAGSVNSFR